MPSKLDINDELAAVRSTKFGALSTSPIHHSRRLDSSIVDNEIKIVHEITSTPQVLGKLNGRILQPLISSEGTRSHAATNIERTSYNRIHDKLQRSLTNTEESNDINMKAVTTITAQDTLLKEAILRKQMPFTIQDIRFHKDSNNIVTIDIHDMGLGDEKGICLAATLSACPNVTTINIAGNIIFM